METSSDVSVNFNLDLSRYTEDYNYVYASIYEASMINTKEDSELTYSNIDFNTLPNGYSTKKKVKIGEKLSLSIKNVPKGLKVIVVVELLNIIDNTSTVIYGGISDVFEIDNSEDYAFTLEKLNSLAPVEKEVFVSFDSNDGTGEMESQQFTSGIVGALKENLFEKPGYKFYKWNTAKDGSGVDYSDCANVKIDSDITLYAIWVTEETVITDFFVTFDSNDGTGEMEKQKFTMDVVSALNANVFENAGYKFLKWNTAKDGSGIDYSDCANVKIDSNITLYAIWIEEEIVITEFFVTFDSNEGTGEMEKQKFTMDVVSVLNGNVFEKTGYKFYKWNTAKDGSGIDYFDCANIQIDSDITLYAIWVTEEEVIYKIEHYKQNLKDDNYTLFESEYRTGMESDKLTQSAKEYIGYNLSNVVLSNEGTVVKVYYDCILCTVTFEFNDETINLDNTQVVKYGATLQKPEISSENKYFYNWYSDEDFTTVFDFAIIVTEDITLYAKWIDLSSSSYEVTDSNVVNVIENLSGEGPHYVKVTGEITDSTILNIRKKIRNNSSCLVILDLSETTGVTKFYSKHITDSNSYTDCNTSVCKHNDFFDVDNLVGIKLPLGLKSVENDSFYSCEKLKSIEIPQGVTTIGNQAFYGCSDLENIIIPESVTSIGEYTFYGCKSLKNVEIPESVTSIGENAFYNCSSLKSVEIPESVTSIGENAFYNCSSLKSVEIPESVTTIGKNAFYNCSSLESIKIPENGTSIGDFAFYNCSSIESFEIPEGVTLGKFSFKGWTNLKYLKIPNSLVISSYESFNGLNLKELCINSDNPNFVFENGCLFTSDKTILCLITTDVKDLVIPETVTKVYNINNFNNLETVKFLNPSTVTCTNCFNNCGNLISVEAVGDFTASFTECYNLKTVTGLGGTSTPSFKYCFNLEYIKIKSKITTIYPKNFAGCAKLQNIEITYLPNRCTSSGYSTGGGYTGTWTRGYSLNDYILEYNESSTSGSWTLYY